jgi:hypothetical protein
MIGDAEMGAIKEEIDEKGRVVGRSFVPYAANNNGGMSDGMLRVIGEQNKILLQSQMDQMREMKVCSTTSSTTSGTTLIPSKS